MKLQNFQKQLKAFTLLELLIAMGILSVISIVVGTTIGQIYLQQRKVALRQDFHNEARLVMEQVVQLIRNNTIDYDRYFETYGPSNCSDFATEQVTTSSTAPTAAEMANDDVDDAVNDANRVRIGYENIVTWDTDFNGLPDRSLGGYQLDGTLDDCAEAWEDTFSYPDGDPRKGMFLINANRTIRTQLKFDSVNSNIEKEVSFAIDLDEDQRADVWTTTTQWDNTNAAGEKCEGEDPTDSIFKPVLGQPTTDDEGQRYCLRPHSLVAINPNVLEIQNTKFLARPNKDPYLAFRVEESQLQPHALIDIIFVLRDPTKYGYSISTRPTTRLQTSASSRVFGDNRY